MLIQNLPKVALKDMNEIHDVEVEILNRLYDELLKEDKDLETIDKLFSKFLEDVKKHFSFEQGLMEKYNFFAYPMHRGEHGRILTELSQLKNKWDKDKDTNLLKQYIENYFVPWLYNHIQTMDTVTAMYLSNFV